MLHDESRLLTLTPVENGFLVTVIKCKILMKGPEISCTIHE